jgi:protein SCO1
MKVLLLLLVQATSPAAGVGVDQNLGREVSLDLVFVDEQGAPVTLRQAAAGRAFILAPVYYRCPQVCTQVLNGLLTSLKRAGDRYQVVAFSFDPREDAALASSKKSAYVKRGADQSWRFLTGRRESIEALCLAVGYRTSYDARTTLYAHPSAVVIVAPDGRISRYFFGIDYPSRDLRLALAEASAGRTGSIVDPILLFCFQYDPATGRYGLAVLRLLRGGGLVTAVIVGFVILRLARRHRRSRLVSAE